MSEENIREKICQAVTISKQMLAFAQDEKWKEFEVCQKQRDVIFRQAFPNAFPDALAELAAQSIAEIKAMDAEIKTLAEHAKRESMQHLKKLNTGNKATKSYTQNQ